jgi:hypothetical protein
MSTKYTGGFITKSPVAPTTTAASGIWTLDQQQQAQKAGTWPSPPIFIEDLFSTYLYAGNSSTQTITNGIDLSGQGGLVWIKNRQTSIGVPIGHILTDTQRGVTKFLRSQSTSAQETSASSITAFNSTGFSFGSDTNINYSGDTYVSWTFREQPKFFDVVTYTGTGSIRTVAHNLGSTPGCMIIKQTSASGENWGVYHRSLGATKRMYLNTTATEATNVSFWNDTEPTSTEFTVGAEGTVNSNGASYVAYLFAHDAGGFPVSGGGSTNGISCGSYAGTGSNVVVNLGYEPQWVMIKNITTSGGGYDWYMADNMRGIPMSGDTPMLQANLSDAESGASQGHALELNATGFTVTSPFGALNNSGNTYIYIAIRRGPMKTPTVGTSVFSPIAAVSGVQTTNFPVDMQILSLRDSASALLNHQVIDRLRGVSSTSTAQGNYLNTTSTAAETSASPFSSILMSNVGFQVGNNYAGGSGVFHSFQRAPSFMDVVCYTGTGVARTVTHNLAAVPELMIVKNRTTTQFWVVYSAFTGATQALQLNTNIAAATSAGNWNNTAPTSSVFTVGTFGRVNESGSNMVAYLFATVAGVSKVGSYTGNGSSQTIACGFTAGSRFVLIKRTDSTGDWYVWDSARGIVAGNDPHLSLNTTAAEVTTDDSVDTDNSGFIVNQDAATDINVTSATYIFLAIA